MSTPSASPQTSPSPLSSPSVPTVLYFYQDFGAMGGIERWLVQVTSRLQATGKFRPVVVCHAQTPLYQALQAEGVSVHGLPIRAAFQASFTRSLDVWTWWALYHLVQAERPAIAHVHIGLLDVLFFRAWGCRLVYSFHGYGTLFSLADEQNPLKRLWKRLTRWLFRQTAAHVDALLLVSEAEQHRLLSEGYLHTDQAGTVVPNGIDTAYWQAPVTRSRVDAIRDCLPEVPPNARWIGYLGRLDANKNPMALVELAEQLASDPHYIDCHVVLVGDGPQRAEIIAATQRLPRLHWLPDVPDIAAFYVTCAVMVYPSRREAFGLSMLEAMATGTPCVATDNPAARSILDTPVLAQHALVPADDEKALAEQVTYWLDCRQEKPIRALQERAAHFDEAPLMTRLTACYNRLLTGIGADSTDESPAGLPRVSVILPVYNGAATVCRALQSVLDQSYPHIEVLVVDDGSTDDTSERLAGIQDARVRVLRQENQGVAVARNRACQLASGEYLAFIDADDLWHPGKLSAEMAIALQHRQSGAPACLIYSGYRAVDADGRLVNLPPVRTLSGDLSTAVLRDEGLFLPSTTLMHRTIWESLGGFSSEAYHEDRVFFIRACQQFPAYPTGKRLVDYQQTPDGRCRRVLQQVDQALSAELSIIDALRPHLAEPVLAQLRVLQLWNLTLRLLMYGYLPSARHVFRQWRTALETTRQQSGRPQGAKAWLAWVSLHSGINFLQGARFMMQAAWRCLPASKAFGTNKRPPRDDALSSQTPAPASSPP